MCISKICALVVLTVVLVGCPRSDGVSDFEWLEERGDFVEVYPESVRGGITLAGSSTVFPLAEALANRFIAEGYAGNVVIDSIGTGGGFERFCVAGESDISNASRPIKEGERENCRQIGREPIEFLIAVDAFSVVVNPENDWITNTTVEELVDIFTAERWSDVNPAWPTEDIQRFVPGTDSGTFDYFVEEVFHKDATPLLEAPHVQFSEDDNVLVQGIRGDTYSIGFFGYAYYANNTDALKILSIEGVEASEENVHNGSYPLSRPLYMYSDAEIMATRPQVAAFVAYSLANASEEAINVGYFPISEDFLAQSRNTWLVALDGAY